MLCPITRRGLFNAGGLGIFVLELIIALLGLGVSVQTALSPPPPPPRFDLTEPSHDLFRSKSLHDVKVQQSFAFDNVNRRLFVAQRRDGSSDTAGDLCITQLDFDGNYVGYMYLTDFGHGVAFGAQGVGSSTYLWTEVEASSSGYGKKLARFKFTSGSTLSSTSSALTKFTPVSEATEHTCSIDPVNNNLVVRYSLSDGKHIAVYGLADAANGDFSSPLADFKQPSLGSLSPTFQGYAAYGQYLYVLTGNSYDLTGGEVNSQVTSINMNTGAIAQGPVLTRAGSTLTYREPEGMAIYQTGAGEVRLFLGFASGEVGDRRSNLFYKNVLV
ncbi:teichoic acid biosynthesis protein C [Lipomyces tetrasporus]|uniref:Teichoic acid biosynthesis protein C n=1 Tax=Lipomyces tetrasporus TaxID=54092 RepID=A0AAD7VVN4_9ASCO|nr:teichoic acid biosynthesis protein C [Lipomyces tetrasporus]KAJ8102400.1 teichoic acid biosynthesis protein C [Lipomyces tetrasporus]